MRKLLTPIVILTVAALLLAGCNLPLGQQGAAAIQTEAAMTVAAQLTAAASAATATLTAAPFPTLATATATVQAATQTSAPPTTACDRGTYVADITYPDNTMVDTGTSFTKTWQLKNIGSCSWTTSYALVFAGGDSMGGPAAQALTTTVNPGQTVNISVNLTAPATNGTYKGNWALRNASGVVFYSGFYVQIVASGGGGGGAFSVTHVGFALSTISDSGGTNCPLVIAHIQANGAGTVTYHWTRSDNANGSPQTLVFGSAGTQDVHEPWYLGSVWAGTTHWLGIYIENPNDQDFGHQEFTTACAP